MDKLISNYLKGKTILCYKKSLNNEPYKFYFHGIPNLKRDHIYIIGGTHFLVYKSNDNNIYYQFCPVSKIKSLQPLLRSGLTVEESLALIEL